MRKLEKKTLDGIAKALVKADVLSYRDIEKVTADPALFGRVLARVKMEPNEAPPKRFFIGRFVVGSCASIALVAAMALALVVLSSRPIEVVRDPTPAASKNSHTPRFNEPDKIVSPDFSRTGGPARVERISTKPEVKSDRPKQSAAQQINYEGDFYALSYAGDPNETERGGRIVRVDVSRSTLFAMGIDVPLENETDTVKADLLIGSDGVTRAIRLVK